jgi:gamma-glutamylputrescine oxidase
MGVAAAEAVAAIWRGAMTAADPTVYGTSWYAATRVAAPERGQLTFDLDVDVCVVGGGLAGLTAAREVARRGWSVAVLEARRVGWAASGRNSGFVLPGFGADLDEIVARVGIGHARALWALSEAGLDYVRTTISDTGMPGVEPRDGWLYVSKVDNGDEHLKLVRMLGEFGVDIEGWPTERVRAALKSDRYFHAIHYRRAFQIHPLNYALGLAAAAEQAGARICEDTPVLSIDPAGVRKRIDTPSARVRAAHIVLAGNVHLGRVSPRVSATVLPVTTYLVTTAPLGPRLAEVVGYEGAVSDTDLADNHYRVVGGDRLLWSGRATAWALNPRWFVRRLRADIRRTFPQLGDVRVEHAWSGTLGRTVHRMPQIGELTPGVWLASGFGGHGLNTTAMAGELIARAIVEGDDAWRMFLPYELVWAGGTLGRGAAQVGYLAHRMRAEFDARRARKRDMARRRAEEMAARGSVDAAARSLVRTAAERDKERDAPAEPPAVASAAAAEATTIQPVQSEPDAAAAPTQAPRRTATAT